MGKRDKEQLQGVGRIAEADDIAPKGTKITEQHVREHQAAMEKAHKNAGLSTDKV